MRLNTGAILRETRPETIITSACRGLARKTSEPKRARSLRELVAFIISIAQQARPNVAGQREDLRAQLISESSRVVKTSGNTSAIFCSKPITTSKSRTQNSGHRTQNERLLFWVLNSVFWILFFHAARCALSSRLRISF